MYDSIYDSGYSDMSRNGNLKSQKVYWCLPEAGWRWGEGGREGSESNC